VADYIFDEPLILLAEDGGLFDQPDRGIAYGIEGKTWVNNHAHVLRASEDVSRKYLLRALENYDVTPWITGSTRAKLTKAGASKIQIPLPPLDEQKRIAAILDKADALRAKRRETLAQLDTLLQSTFLDMFGDPVTNPMGWEMTELGSLIESGDKINYGVVQPGDDVANGRPLIRVGDFATGNLNLDDLKHIDPGIEAKYKRSRLNGREILVSCVGSVGTICKVPTEAEGFNIARAVARVPLLENISRDFMMYCLRSEGVQRHFLKETRTVSQPTLNISLIKTAPVIQPPEDLQLRFASIVQAIERQRTQQLAHLDELDTLFASLQSRAFRGEL
jgi:type I restriction enzyme S subunit